MKQVYYDREANLTFVGNFRYSGQMCKTKLDKLFGQSTLVYVDKPSEAARDFFNKYSREYHTQH